MVAFELHETDYGFQKVHSYAGYLLNKCIEESLRVHPQFLTAIQLQHETHNVECNLFMEAMTLFYSRA